MLIKKLNASFGKLENEELELKPGLNIIEKPNEAGKSTWCAFIRTMLYGVDTSKRLTHGSMPDKKRYLPLGKYSMGGSMEIEWQGKSIVLSREGRAGKPMGDCTARLAGTAEKLPELCSRSPGEILTGVSESVFTRSAFISSSAMEVKKDPELEKRISALAASGNEGDRSYSEAKNRLKKQLSDIRRNSSSGLIPELEKDIEDKKEKLDGIRAENERLSESFEAVKSFEMKKEKAEWELFLNKKTREREQAETARLAQERRKKAERELSELQKQAGELSAEGIEMARLALQSYIEADTACTAALKDNDDYIKLKEKAEQASRKRDEAALYVKKTDRAGLIAAGKALAEYKYAGKEYLDARTKAENARSSMKSRRAEPVRIKRSGIIAGSLLLIAAFVLTALYLTAIKNPAIIAAGAVFFVISAVLISVGALKAGAGRRTEEKTLIKLQAELEQLETNEKEELTEKKQAEEKLLRALEAIGAETIPERAEKRIAECEQHLGEYEKALSEYKTAEEIRQSRSSAPEKARAAEKRRAEAEKRLTEALSQLGEGGNAANARSFIEGKNTLLNKLTAAQMAFEAAKTAESGTYMPDKPDEDTALLPEPELTETEAQLLLEEAEQGLKEHNRIIYTSEGELKYLGDPLVLETEIFEKQEKIRGLGEDYSVLELALSVLDEANAELQTQFAPIVGKKTGEFLSEMTGGSYSRAAFDHDFHFLAGGAEGGEIDSDYLSSGTLAQLYLSVRLAVCLLVLDGEENCPIILDDALISFDDERAKAAIKLLLHLSEKRQIILFTCQGREKLFEAQLLQK